MTSKIRREIKKRGGERKTTAPPIAFSGISGSLKDMTALDILQTLELGKKTAHVVLQYNDGRNGELNVQNGDLRGAVCGNLLGEEAFYLLIRPADGLFRIEYTSSPAAENITKPNTFLMIEAMRRLDEAERNAKFGAPLSAPATPRRAGSSRKDDVAVPQTSQSDLLDEPSIDRHAAAEGPRAVEDEWSKASTEPAADATAAFAGIVPRAAHRGRDTSAFRRGHAARRDPGR